MAVTMKNVVFWDIKTQFVLHREHITSPLQSPARLKLCKIWCFHGGDYEECRLLACYAVWLLYSSFSNFRTMYKVQNPSNSECHTPSPDSFRFNFGWCLIFCYKYLNIPYISAQLAIFSCTIWFHTVNLSRQLGAAAGPLRGWHCTAVHMFSICL
jgi:hypothetical protein